MRYIATIILNFIGLNNKKSMYGEKIICPVCGTKCGRQRTHKDACSIKCKRILNGLVLENKNQHKECAVCKTVFIPTRNAGIYCSPECSKIFHKSKLSRCTSEFSIFKRDNFKCIYCGKSSIEDGVKLIIEHIEPFSLGGLTDINNLITSCQDCNSSKAAIPLPKEILKRVLSVLDFNNKNLSSDELSVLMNDIEKLRHADRQRMKSLKKIA